MIQGIGHLAFCVRDLDTALEFYMQKLGLRRLFHLGSDDAPWLVYLRVSHGQYIELFPEKEAAQREKQCFSHLCLQVTEIEQEVARLRALGVQVGDVSLGEDGNYQAWLADPDGNRIELMQMQPDGIQRTLDRE